MPMLGSSTSKILNTEKVDSSADISLICEHIQPGTEVFASTSNQGRRYPWIQGNGSSIFLVLKAIKNFIDLKSKTKYTTSKKLTKKKKKKYQ